jgi:NADPH:quinone reductase
MRGAVVERPTPDGHPEIREVERPSPGQGEVLIHVAFAAANWSDIQKRQGTYPDPVEYPVILGAEASGTIVAIGAGVSTRLLGRATAALCGPRLVGGCADYVAVPVNYLVPLPDGFALDEAAAFPLAAVTAYHLLHTAHRLRRDEVVLVHAAAGSVGLAVVQLAVQHGARVIGTVGTPTKRQLPAEYGAALVIDRSADDFVDAAQEFTGGRGVDLVIDSLGGEILPRSFDALRHYGRLINIGEASGEPNFPVRKKLYERSTSMAGFEVLHAQPGSPRWRRGVRHVTAAAAAGRLRIPIAKQLTLAEIAEAHGALEGRTTQGKVLIRVGSQ